MKTMWCRKQIFTAGSTLFMDWSDGNELELRIYGLITCTTASRLASAMISAQDTMPGHMASTWLLMSSTMSYPRTVKLGTASRSAVLLGVEAINTDPSHPWNFKCTTKSSSNQFRVSLFKFLHSHREQHHLNLTCVFDCSIALKHY